MQYYPEKIGGWMRSTALSYVLLRGGLNISFAGKGIRVLLLIFLPQLCEAIAVGLTFNQFFNIPWALSFGSGFMMAAIANAVVVPICLSL